MFRRVRMLNVVDELLRARRTAPCFAGSVRRITPTGAVQLTGPPLPAQFDLQVVPAKLCRVAYRPAGSRE